jgi:BirA family biotin operon repressor/biotin-[acetyl-CoA-carboxylase] ligase
MTKKEDLLLKKEVLNGLTAPSFYLLDNLEIKNQTDSTNDDAKESLKKPHNKLSAHLAEQQNSGRGRNNRKWVSPFGQNIYLSLGWRSNLTFSNIEGLSLAVGVRVAESLEELINEKIKIKWPNDLLINEKKLGGILIETSSDEKGTLEIIIGIGINVFMKNKDTNEIDQSWTSLENYKKRNLDRNLIAAKILNNLLALTKDFKTTGFAGYIQAFENRNALENKECEVILDGKVSSAGLVTGINNKGELLIKINNEIINLRYGEVSIREL